MAKKRKRISTSDAGQQQTEVKDEVVAEVQEIQVPASNQNSELIPYEIQRQQLIERNRARLLALGIPMAVAGLQEVAQKVAEASRPTPTAPRAPRPKPSAPSGPVRRSSRLKEHAQLQQEADEALRQGDRELAMFIIDGECPKCGKVYTKGHRQHLESCPGIVEPPEPTEEEKEQKARQRRQKNEDKLLALSLRGLVDFNDEHAKFIVIGSTGTPYPVTLTDAKRTCACVDHRCRKHDCKHIRLILKQLGIEDKPKQWKEAVERHFQSQLALAEAPDTGGGAAKSSAGEAANKQTGPIATSTTNDNGAIVSVEEQGPSKRKVPRTIRDGAPQSVPKDPNREAALKFL